jgi:hypothetical protein
MEKIENDKNMIVLKPVGNAKSPGYTAVFMDLSQPKGRINIIGSRQNSSMSLFITSKTESGMKYTRLGQADKRSYIFDKNLVSGTITGAAIGRADSRGFIAMRYLEGSIKAFENSKNVYVKGISAKENTAEAIPDEADKTTSDKNNNSLTETAQAKQDKKDDCKDTEPDPKEKIAAETKQNVNVPKKEEQKKEDVPKKETVTVEKTAVTPDKKPTIQKKTATPVHKKNTNYTPLKDEVKAEDTFKKIMNDFTSQMKKLEALGIINSDEAAEIQASGTDKKKNDIFSINEKVYPFDNSSFDWVKGSIDDLWAMGISAKKLYRAFIMSKECQNGNIIIGSPFDRSCVVVGVPCDYAESDKKTAKEIGFVDFWKSCPGISAKTNGNFGYWIMNM